MFSTSATCRLNDLRNRCQPRSRRRSVSYDFANVNKLKSWKNRSTIRVAWSSPTMCLTSATCHLSDLRQPQSRRRSVSCDLAYVNKPKLQNFDRPLGLPGHRRQGLDVGNVSYRRKMTVRVRTTAIAIGRGACRHRLHFAENPQFFTFFSPSVLRNSISHCAFCFIPTPTIKGDSNEEPEVDTCSPSRQAL